MGGRRRSSRIVGLVGVVAASVVGVAVPGGSAGAAASPVVPFRSMDVFVRQQFADFQGRSATASEASSYGSALTEGTRSAAQTVDAVAHLGSAAGRTGGVARLYTAYFQRLPDVGGLDYWVGKSAAGSSLNTISANFAGSSEFKRKYGSLTNAGFVDLAYENVFGRPADPSGRAYWIKKLDAGTSRGVVMVSYSTSGEYQRKQASTVEMVIAYRGLLRRIPTGTEASDATGRVQADGFAALAGDLLAEPAYAARFPAPGAPKSLVAHGGDGKVTLVWKAPTTNGATLAGYSIRVTKGGVQQGADRTAAAGALSSVITGLTNGQSYVFTVLPFTAARDGASASTAAVRVRPEATWGSYQGNAAHNGVQPVGTIPTTPTRKWRAQFPRPVEDVAVGDGRVFVVTKGDHDETTVTGNSVYALDPVDGSIEWGPVVTKGGSRGFAHLAYEGWRLFVDNDDGYLTALESGTGATLWHRDLNDSRPEQEGLVVAGGSVYGLDENGLVAINAATGAVKWRVTTPGNDFGEIAVDASGVYLAQPCNRNYKFTTAGKLVWNTDNACGSDYGGGLPALANGRMWTMGSDVPRVRSQSTGAQVGTGRGREPVAVTSTRALYNDLGTLRGVDWSTSAVKWSQAGDGEIQGSPVVNGSRAFIATSGGRVYSFAVDTGTPGWSFEVAGDFPDDDNPSTDTLADIGALAIGDGLLLVPMNGFEQGGVVVAYG